MARVLDSLQGTWYVLIPINLLICILLLLTPVFTHRFNCSNQSNLSGNSSCSCRVVTCYHEDLDASLSTFSNGLSSILSGWVHNGRHTNKAQIVLRIVGLFC